ncbi:DUF4350 domain-containing protein [Lysobacter humi (ex Lee et al. 2017)]
MSRTRIALLVALMLALVGGATAWWLHTFKRVDRWITLPRTGEAASNPLFGLRVVLETQGRRVRPAYRLDLRAMQPGPRDVIVYDGDPRLLDAPTTDALADWLRRGGHLVVALPPNARDIEDFVRPELRSGTARRRGRLLAELGIRPRDDYAPCASLRVGKEPTSLFCGDRRFDAPAGALRRWGDAGDGDVFARLRMPGGRGTIDVLASMGPLTTDGLEDAETAAFALQLFPARSDGVVHLVHATDIPSLWATLLREGWRVWLPLVLLLAGWLLARMRRLGPLQPTPERARRSLLEHVGASGEHQWRYGQAVRLHEAMRDAFLARLRRRDPHTAALEGHVQAVALAERLKFSVAQIQDALTPPDPRDRKAFVARIRTLVRMRNRL